MDGTQTEPQTPDVVEEPTNLPSDEQAWDESVDWETVSEGNEYLKQFKSLDDMTSKYKELHSQYSQTIQKQKEAERGKQQEQAKQQEQTQLIQEQQEAIRELLPKYLENDMILTSDMEQTLTEKGLDIRDVKLGALELKDRVSKAHSVVGGKEEYDNMIAWGQENMSDAQKNAFDKDIVGNFSEYAIKGLYNDYKNATKDMTPADRVRGSSTPVGIKPYATQSEMLRDRDFINSGRASESDRAKHNARLDVTPDKVLFG